MLLAGRFMGTRQYLLWFLIIASWNLANAFPTTEEISPIKNSFEELRERYRRDAKDTITCDAPCTCQCSSTGAPQTSEVTSVGTTTSTTSTISSTTTTLTTSTSTSTTTSTSTSTSATSTSTTVPVPALPVLQQVLPRLVRVPALPVLQQALQQQSTAFQQLNFL
ncbi:unnamed protein product [Rotaria socialis]|uniref:Uncharacterized protein n=1 Tax=Rotaria socialis TaxID=392032 RepID=A0A818PHJ0_9BILA|nr:unnamed protein product [Rotaria socialis]